MNIFKEIFWAYRVILWAFDIIDCCPHCRGELMQHGLVRSTYTCPTCGWGSEE